MAERNADALEDICSFFNANHDRSGTPRHRPHAEIVVEADGTVRTINGRVLDTACARMLLCDCVLHRVLKAGSSILDYGRATRSVPYPTFRALAIRDGGCRVAGCDRPVAWTDGHHVEHWEHDGPTDLDNLCLLCRRHHRSMHTNGWTLTMDPTTTPSSSPPPPAKPSPADHEDHHPPSTASPPPPDLPPTTHHEAEHPGNRSASNASRHVRPRCSATNPLDRRRV